MSSSITNLSDKEFVDWLRDTHLEFADDDDPEDLVIQSGINSKLLDIYHRGGTSADGIGVASAEYEDTDGVHLVYNSDVRYMKDTGHMPKPYDSHFELEDMELIPKYGVIRYTLTNGMKITQFVIGQEVYQVCTRAAAHTRVKMIKTASLSNVEPGVYGVKSTPFEIQVYKEDNFDPGGEIVHQNKGSILGKIDRFFDNLDIYLQNGGDGTHSILVYGPPGTGKTELNRTIMDQHRDDKVVGSVDIRGAQQLAAMAAENDLSAVIIVEDAEQYLENPNSSILNWMDGANRTRNEQGMLFIYTTNYPNQIGEQAMRPGRIDDTAHMGTLNEISGLECLSYYLPDDHNLDMSNDELRDIVNNEPGTVIEDLVRRSRAIAMGNQETLAPEHLAQAMEDIRQQKETYEDYDTSDFKTR